MMEDESNVEYLIVNGYYEYKGIQWSLGDIFPEQEGDGR